VSALTSYVAYIIMYIRCLAVHVGYDSVVCETYSRGARNASAVSGRVATNSLSFISHVVLRERYTIITCRVFDRCMPQVCLLNLVLKSRLVRCGA